MAALADTQRVVEQVLGLISGVSALVALVLVIIGLRARKRPRRFCAGGGRGWRAFVSPCRWVWNPVCGYDLAGLPRGEDGRVRCPECGVESRSLRMARRPSAFRPLGAAGIAWSVAAACMIVARDRAGSWAGAFPTVALVALERELPGRFSKAARRELQRRMDASEVLAVEARLLSEQLTAELRADERWHNGWRAARRLAELWPHSEAALERGLRSHDRQARVLAAWVLREKRPFPTESLLRASLEDLADDRDSGLDFSIQSENASAAARYLVLHPDPARPYVEQAMRWGDWQQRLLGAAIAAQSGMRDLAGLAAPILIEHLGDNDIENDAHLAARLLLSLGEPIADVLESHRDDPDIQRRQLCRAILARLGRPTDPAMPELDRPPRISEGGIDPLSASSPLGDVIRLDLHRGW